jgi:cell division topological specificity factor
MSILDFFSRRRQTAPVARERLQVLLAHERALSGGADLAAVLKQEILEVIARHIPIDRDRVMVKLDRGEQVSTLEIDVEMPDEALTARRAPEPPAKRRRKPTVAARS